MDKLEHLSETLDGHTKLLIIPHNDPDPDAIAAAVGLRYLVAEMFGVEAKIRYHGIIGRAENKVLVRYLKKPLKKLYHVHIDLEIPIALIDTQPGAGNHPLPENIQSRIVIDHHYLQEPSSLAHFVDIRPDIGASATILTEYIRDANIYIPPSLATALFYGIKTDTMGLGRGASPDDSAAYFFLQPMIVLKLWCKLSAPKFPQHISKALASLCRRPVCMIISRFPI